MKNLILWSLSFSTLETVWIVSLITSVFPLIHHLFWDNYFIELIEIRKQSRGVILFVLISFLLELSRQTKGKIISSTPKVLKINIIQWQRMVPEARCHSLKSLHTGHFWAAYQYSPTWSVKLLQSDILTCTWMLCIENVIDLNYVMAAKFQWELQK